MTPAEYGRLLFGFVDRRPAPSALYFNDRGTALKKRLEHVLNFEADKPKRSKSQLAIPILIGLVIVPFSIRDAYTLPSPIAPNEEPMPASVDGRAVMALDVGKEKPAVWEEAIPADDMELPEEDIGDQDVWAKADEGEQKAKKMPDPFLEKEISERIPEQKPSSPTYIHPDRREKDIQTGTSLFDGADAREVLDFNRVETEPKILHAVNPVYPESAQNAGLNNSVFLKFRVNVDGSVSNVSVLRGYNIFRQAAIDALSQWRFEPAKHKGKAVPVWMVQSIAFREPQSPVAVDADTSGVLKKNEGKEKPHSVAPEYLREADKKKSPWVVRSMVNLRSSKDRRFTLDGVYTTVLVRFPR